MSVFAKMVTAMAVSVTLLACGGGGSSGPAGTTGIGGASNTLPPVTENDGGNGDRLTLSATQTLFEESALAANGGMYSIIEGSSVSAGATTTKADLTRVSANRIEVAVSPLGTPSGVMGTYLFTQASSVALSQLAFDARNENAGFTVVDNGQIRFVASAAPARYTYVGNDVWIELAAIDGEIATRRRITGVAKIPLTGNLADAPVEFLDFYRNLLPHVRPGTSFLPGAAYYRLTGARLGEHFYLQDADNNIATDAKSATPIAAGTVEQYAAANPTRIDWSGGTFKTVKGVHCWVSKEVGTFVVVGAVTYRYADLPTSGAVCEIAQKVYLASVVSDGAQVGSTTNGKPFGTDRRAPFLVSLNKAAFDSIKAMLP